eukprot:2494504-Prorocentrum_lima.AAC.1
MGCRGIFAGLEETGNQPGFYPFDAIEEVLRTGSMGPEPEKTFLNHIYLKYNKWFTTCLCAKDGGEPNWVGAY